MAREFGERSGSSTRSGSAIERDEFSVHYQPEVDDRERGDRRRRGADALELADARQRAAEASSSRLAEGPGLIIELGEFALREACRQTASWESQGVLPERFVTWVNLSGKQLSGGGIDELVHSALAASGIPPRRLGLEITETSIVQGGVVGERACGELAGAAQRRRRHRHRRLRDGLLVARAAPALPGRHDQDRPLVRAGRRARPEGRGDHRQRRQPGARTRARSRWPRASNRRRSWRRVRELGCDLAQGFLFARAMPPDELSERLRDRLWERVPEAA